MNLALVANNIGLMWVAIEMATLTTVVMVGIYRTPRGARGGVEIFHPRQRRHRARPVRHDPRLYGRAAGARRGAGRHGLDRSLIAHVAEFDPALLNLAFVFLLLGYGTKVGLAPLHAWLPDAHAEGPTPISAVLSGLLLNVALYAVLRFKMLLAANRRRDRARPADGRRSACVSLIFAAFMLYRRRDIKRLFAYSSIEHMGIIVFAFGMGGPLANFAGLLHMTMHSLTKSAIFFTVGHIAQVKGTQRIADIRGLTVTPSVARLDAWSSASSRSPACRRSASSPASSWSSARPSRASRCWRCCWSSACCVAFGALLLRLQGMAFGEPRGRRQAGRRASYAADRSPISRWCWSPASICRRRWSPGSSTSRRCCG